MGGNSKVMSLSNSSGNKAFGPLPDPLPKPEGMKHIIAVISGKGGVGKSTVSANLAASLLLTGSSVGLLDADLTGYSQSILFEQKTDSRQLAAYEPADCYGIKVASFGFLYPEATTVIWRGPMISNGIKSLFTQTKWGNIDYLIIDLPPGTSDAQLTILRDMPISGGIVVTTPDNLASAVAERGLRMLFELKKRVLGIVENMSWALCEHCGRVIDIFGAEAGLRLAQKHEIELLGRIPIDPEMKKAIQLRKPIVFLSPDSPSSKVFQSIAEALVRNLRL